MIDTGWQARHPGVFVGSLLLTTASVVDAAVIRIHAASFRVTESRVRVFRPSHLRTSGATDDITLESQNKNLASLELTVTGGDSRYARYPRPRLWLRAHGADVGVFEGSVLDGRRWSFTRLPAGTYQGLLADGASVTRLDRLDLKNGASLKMDCELSKPQGVVVFVTDAEGRFAPVLDMLSFARIVDGSPAEGRPAARWNREFPSEAKRRINSLAPGTFRVDLVVAGYRPEWRDVVVHEGRVSTLRIELSRAAE